MDIAAKTCGMTEGKVYEMKIFHAERHTVGSTFLFETNMPKSQTKAQIPTVKP